MNRRGDGTISQQFVLAVTSIAGFVVVIIMLGTYFGTDTSSLQERELCRLGVLTRATTPDVLQANVPLKCTTEKICFTTKAFGKCEQFAGEENVRRVKLPGDVDAAARVIEKESANAMYDCWTMMGQGKLDLFAKASESLVGSSGEPTCVVCSRLALAQDVVDSPEMKNLGATINMDRYLEDTQIPGQSITYLQAFTDLGARSFGSASDIAKLQQNIPKKEVNIRGTSDNQIAFIFSQVKTQEISKVMNNLGLAATGASFVLPSKILGLLYAGPQALVTVPVTAVAVGGVALNAYQGQQASAGYCGKFTSADVTSSGQEPPGCSLVRAVNYNIQDLNTFCPASIQGNP